MGDKQEHVFGSAGYWPGVKGVLGLAAGCHSLAFWGHARHLLLACDDHLRMFHALGNYFHERRRGFSKAAGYVGGAYLVGRYVSQRLEDVRVSLLQERASQDKCVFS